ncbi:hypothetical protein AYO49_05440 [Verrucomicrobiaceae bacterium SCGC AG-212-N21]|nr:hypothetical protein AYO49_05440 [Verrucomicrobiaceae bacterium SCGC AG-212-N21]
MAGEQPTETNMAKLKISMTQDLLLTQAMNNLYQVLREVKAKPLEGEALGAMKTLESGVQYLEAFKVSTKMSKKI